MQTDTPVPGDSRPTLVLKTYTLVYQVHQYLECNKLMKESLLWSMCGEWWWWCVYNI